MSFAGAPVGGVTAREGEAELVPLLRRLGWVVGADCWEASSPVLKSGPEDNAISLTPAASGLWLMSESGQRKIGQSGGGRDGCESE